MAFGRSKVLARLRKAVAKTASLIPPGLLDATDIGDEWSYYLFGSGSPPTRPSSSLRKAGGSSASPPHPLGTTSPPLLRTRTPPLRRTMSRAASGSSASSASDDINQRADEFIENFYRQLRMERQISLELRYCNGK
ncbi:hypothetical protein HPP92_010271 [Vanilla planifolia]|uniref:Uncharacterized protein n=1 Tax=Vanilla planifolia TaxID=51239 RepID=A0A835RA54_VANPL|nr:hypothetical protein HPP92_010271 [Vanilla planifolia]